MRRELEIEVGDFIRPLDQSYGKHIHGNQTQVLAISRTNYGRKVTIDCVAPACTCNLNDGWSIYEEEWVVVRQGSLLTKEEIEKAVPFPSFDALERFIR